MDEAKTAAALKRIYGDQRQVLVSMVPWQILSTALAVQLATKHPQFTGGHVDEAISTAKQFFALIVSIEPDLAELVAEGWKPVPAPPPPPANGLGIGQTERGVV